MSEIFESAVRPAGDYAGVFEYDGETGYFYLCATGAATGLRVLDHLHVVSGAPGFTQADVSVRWDAGGEKVGLFIQDVLWAVFDCARRTKYGGDYGPGRTPALPSGAEIEFTSS